MHFFPVPVRVTRAKAAFPPTTCQVMLRLFVTFPSLVGANWIPTVAVWPAPSVAPSAGFRVKENPLPRLPKPAMDTLPDPMFFRLKVRFCVSPMQASKLS